jgi:hypothetical protein
MIMPSPPRLAEEARAERFDVTIYLIRDGLPIFIARRDFIGFSIAPRRGGLL